MAFFFFQAEDGIRDGRVTGVQTCALPISLRWSKQTTRVSVSSGGAEGNRYSESPSISADGRFVAFASDASNLVSGDRNGQRDVFVRDRRARKTTRVSVGSPEVKTDGFSYSPSISADGRFVAFASEASDLVRGDRNVYSDVFVRDRKAGETTLVSVSSTGAGGVGSSGDPSISADGRLVAFGSLAPNLVDGDSNDHGDTFVRDRRTGKTTRVSISSRGVEADGESGGGGISADGRFVAFSSHASNLVAEDRRGLLDVFVRGPLR